MRFVPTALALAIALPAYAAVEPIPAKAVDSFSHVKAEDDVADVKTTMNGHVTKTAKVAEDAHAVDMSPIKLVASSDKATQKAIERANAADASAKKSDLVEQKPTAQAQIDTYDYMPPRQDRTVDAAPVSAPVLVAQVAPKSDVRSTDIRPSVRPAVTSTKLPSDDVKYFFSNGRFILGDDGRGAKDGGGVATGIGFSFDRDLIVETYLFANSLRGEGTSSDANSKGAGIDLVHRFKPYMGVTPYVLGGLGVGFNDAYANTGKSMDLFMNAGVGALVPITDGLAGRVEVRRTYDTAFDGISDTIFGLGLQADYGRIKEKLVRVERQVFVDKPVEAPADVDSDGDNVPDSRDACPNTMPSVVINNKGCAIQSQIVRFDKILFELNSATLASSANSYLDRVASMLKEQPELTIEIAGHTDSDGDDKANLQLSKDRATAVTIALKARGVDGKRLRAMGYGEIAPIAPNDTPEGRAKNRRVELRID